MKQMNKRHRGRNAPTDVLSFSVEEGSRVVLPKSKVEPKEMGDIFICSSFAKREAKRRGIPVSEEMVRLLVHGTMHLMGFDHATEKDEHKMFRLQEEIVEQVMK